MNAVAAIVLAAGGSTRLGQPKQLVRFGGRALVRHAAEVALDSGCAPVVLVLGAEAEACATELRGLPVRLAFNADWRSGMAGSLRTGLDALAESDAALAAALLCLCDQPHVSSETLRAIVAAHRADGARIVASEYAGTLGAPALFHASLFEELRALRGDEGARRLFARFPSEVVSIPHAAAALDLDTPADHDRLITAISEDQAAG